MEGRFVAHLLPILPTRAIIRTTVPDDRIVAAALRLQSDHPAGVVVLVTADLNLQNKAAAAGLPYAEPPAPFAS